MLRIPPELLCDFYKLAHRPEYPKNTQEVLSTWTARSSRTGETKVMFFGMQGFIESMLVDYFNENFFERPREEVLAEYVRFVHYTLNDPNPESAHIAALWDLGYLPIEIRALPEGARVPLRVPVATFVNTLPEFFWLTNALETLISVGNWISTTSATTAFRYRVILEKWAKITGADPAGVLFQAHDFSMRGMAGLDAAIMSGAAHLTSFVGTDTCPAIFYHEAYYGANIETELVGTSIPASEHSVMSAGGLDEGEELATYRRLITEVHPSGFVSIVSDTVDLFRVIDEYLPILKEAIMARDGRVVIRPDSGDPADIICGTARELGGDTSEAQGVIERLWEIFGGTVNEAGYKVLDPHIGAIYGDSITTARADEICERLAHKGFASSNIVFGVGSYSYQGVTRDSYGWAMKAVNVIINGISRAIFKDPKTDKDHSKRSARGRVKVLCIDNEYVLFDGCTPEEVEAPENMLVPIFRDGVLLESTTLAEIRARVNNEVKIELATAA
jgi:nicotinamide phosphoribosyltransferase